jgi:predicted metalloprotease with PDZ domain
MSTLRLFIVLVGILIVHAGAVFGQPPAGNVYQVHISLSDPPSAEITAKLRLKNGRLFMIGGSVDDLPRGWATFVKGLKATDEQGTGLPLVEFSDDSYKTQWKVGDGSARQVNISYRVDLSFAKTKWEAGNEQAAYYDGRALFAASRVLFIVSDLADQNQVRFDLPSTAKLDVPWPTAGSARDFTTNGEDLVDNTLVAGDFADLHLRAGDFHFTVALLGKVRSAAPLISRALSKYAHMYGRLFDRTPPANYLMTLFYAEDEDGESYSQSAAFTTQPLVTEDNMIMWGNTLGHELFHYWNGRQISGAVNTESQWFQEGFTEYYANLALMRENIMPEKYFIWKLQSVLGKYLYFRGAPQFSEVSIKNSGLKKTSYRFGVYDGGWAVAFGLDLTLREKTAGRKSLDDFMRLMFQKFGLTGTRYTFSDIVTTASEVAGTDLSDFFKRYVEGKEILPIRALLQRLGYDSLSQDYADELYIYPLKPTALKLAWLKPN